MQVSQDFVILWLFCDPGETNKQTKKKNDDTVQPHSSLKTNVSD